MAASGAFIFSSLEKFSDGNGTELNAFLSKFDRCCSVLNKADGDVPVKGQLLMLFVEGRARAALEEFELTQAGAQQTYAVLSAKLREYFDSSSARENSMILFEGHMQKVTESEEEFMLSLVRLYNAANPTHDAAVQLLAIKRKFMAGIMPSLRSKIYIFCQDPYAAAVTREHLLGYCRQARNMLAIDSGDNVERSTDKVLSADTSQDLVAAISNLTLKMNEQIQATNKRLDEITNTVAAVNTTGNQYTGNYWRGGRRPRGGRFRGGARGGSARGGFTPRKCFRCGDTSHMVRNCTYKSNQSN